MKVGRALMLALAAAAMPLSALADGARPAAARPMRVMSINECTDQFVLALLPPARIASVSRLSRDPGSSLMAAAARRVAANDGSSEDVLRDRPDLVIAGSFTTSGTRAMLRRLGRPPVEIGPVDDFEQIRQTTRAIAVAVGEQARGEALIAHMDAGLARLAQERRPPLRVAAWDGAGFAGGAGSLLDTMLRAGGFVNVAADPGVMRRGVPDTELLLATAPDLIVQGGGATDRAGLRADIAYHPIVRRYWGRDRIVTVPSAWFVCGTPFAADAALALRDRLQARAAAVRAPLPLAGHRR